jgi:sterol desaturase/sphingolipid hydroxylase (fatty acid hydroxylase superfamily)
MFDTILDNESSLRFSFFLVVLIVGALWETAAPRRDRTLPRWTRWPSNLGIVALNTVMLRVFFPLVAVTMAISASANSWGFFNFLELPVWLEVILAIALLDMAIYLQHLLFHAVPTLWKVHRMHHADLDFDVTTGGRFHPVEIALSMLIKLSVVFMLGASPMAVILFEILLNASATFNHGNIRIPMYVDRALRLFVVTPDMHRVHHSILPGEMNSNFGFSLPWWDHLFGTYRAQPEGGHEDMTIGINAFREPTDQRLDNMLMQPLRGGAPGYAIKDRRKPNPDK